MQTSTAIKRCFSALCNELTSIVLIFWSIIKQLQFYDNIWFLLITNIFYSQICPNEMKNSSTHWLIWRLNRSVDYCCNEDSLLLESLFSHLLDILRLLNRLGWEAFIHTDSFSTEHVDCFFLHALGNLFVCYRQRYTRWENVATIFTGL